MIHARVGLALAAKHRPRAYRRALAVMWVTEWNRGPPASVRRYIRRFDKARPLRNYLHTKDSYERWARRLLRTLE